ncbi:sodium-coupled monocarboxylate transporter 2-like protein, partial [Leptotrombidium deliense]
TGFLVTIYTAIGGLKAVIWTDVIQYFFITVGTLSIIYFGVSRLVNTTLYTLIGLILYANYYKCDPILDGKIKITDEIVPLFMNQIFRSIPGCTGLFIVCLLSAALSTLSSGVNVVATLVWEDILTKRLPNMKPNKSVKLTKIIAATVGLICIAVAFLSKEFGSIFEVKMTFDCSICQFMYFS